MGNTKLKETKNMVTCLCLFLFFYSHKLFVTNDRAVKKRSDRAVKKKRAELFCLHFNLALPMTIMDHSSKKKAGKVLNNNSIRGYIAFSSWQQSPSLPIVLLLNILNSKLMRQPWVEAASREQ